MSELYDFSAKTIMGFEYSLEELKEKVVLIVNTASKCGFTKQYEGLQKLYDKYKDEGLIIMGFPSNDFLRQEPGTNSEIMNFCEVNFGINFPMYEKIRVRGKDIHPLYKFLTEGAGNEHFKGAIKWNFTKFLFDRKGIISGRFPPQTKPEDIEGEIKKLL